MLRTGMFRKVSVGRAPVNWPRLIFRYTDQKAREQLAQLQSKFAEVAGLFTAVPKEVPEIDWDYWRKEIRTGGIVDRFKSEYEEEMKKETKLNTAEVEAKKRAQETEIRALEAKVQTSHQFLSELKPEIEWLQHWYDNVEDVTKGSPRSWNKFKRDHYYPTYKIHRMNRFLFLGNPMQDTGRAVAKIDNVDLVELRKQLEAGNVRAMAAVAPIMSEVTDLDSLKRPFTKKWIKPVNYEEIFKTPTSSLSYRAFALKQIAGV